MQQLIILHNGLALPIVIAVAVRDCPPTTWNHWINMLDSTDPLEKFQHEQNTYGTGKILEDISDISKPPAKLMGL